MRPARKGPENRAFRKRFNALNMASMRPARKGPENLEPRPQPPTLQRVASMRPARKGPENPSRPCSVSSTSSGFNEAGPQGAGKPHFAEEPIWREWWLQ